MSKPFGNKEKNRLRVELMHRGRIGAEAALRLFDYYDNAGRKRAACVMFQLAHRFDPSAIRGAIRARYESLWEELSDGRKKQCRKKLADWVEEHHCFDIVDGPSNLQPTE